MKLQLARMHKQFGREHVHACGTCCNFVRGEYHDKMLQKCERYGLSHSDATDWAKSWGACGMYNVPIAKGERPLKDYVDKRRVPEVAEGQVSMLGMEEAPEAYVPDK